MSIASAIEVAQEKIANAYTVISDKGGTLPQIQNLTNISAAINSIPNSNNGILESIMTNIVAGNNPVDITELQTVETSISTFLTI